MSDITAEAIFDAFAKVSAALHRQDARRREIAQLQSRSRRECGNCEHWMKSRQCPLDNQRRGFPGMSYPGCGKYEPTRDAMKATANLTSAIAASAKP